MSNPFPRPRCNSYPTPPDHEAIQKIKRPKLNMSEFSNPSSTAQAAEKEPAFSAPEDTPVVVPEESCPKLSSEGQ